MKPEGSLPHSQVPATWLYPKPARSSPCPIFHFLRIHLNIILPNMPGSSKWCLSLRFPHQNPAHASPPPKSATPRPSRLLDFITRTILGEDHGSLSSSLCSFLHSSVTLSLLGRNIPSTHYSQTPSAYVPQSMWAERPSFTPIANNRQNYSSVYLNL